MDELYACRGLFETGDNVRVACTTGSPSGGSALVQGVVQGISAHGIALRSAQFVRLVGSVLATAAHESGTHLRVYIPWERVYVVTAVDGAAVPEGL